MSFRRFFIIMLAALLLTGCNATGRPTEDPVPETPVLRVGMECNYAPFNWTTTTAGDTTVPISSVDYADGFDVVIASLLAQQLGMQVQIVKLDWDNLIPALQHDQIDAVIAGMTDTPARREVVDFTAPYYISEEVIIVRQDSDLTGIQSIAQLAGYRVQGQMNTIYDEIIDQIEGVQHFPAAETFPAAIQALLAGGVDAVTSELPVAVGVVTANPQLTYVRFTGSNGFAGSETDASVSIAVRKGNTELLNQLQSALDTISEAQRQQLMLEATDRQPAGE